MVEDKRRQVIDFISRQAVDPKTNLPHPPCASRMRWSKFVTQLIPYKPVEEQAKDIVKLLRPILPLKIEQVTVAVKIPAEYSARAYGTIKTLGTIKREEWRGDGSWYGEIELPAGSYASLLNKTWRRN